MQLVLRITSLPEDDGFTLVEALLLLLFASTSFLLLLSQQQLSVRLFGKLREATSHEEALALARPLLTNLLLSQASIPSRVVIPQETLETDESLTAICAEQGEKTYRYVSCKLRLEESKTQKEEELFFVLNKSN